MMEKIIEKMEEYKIITEFIPGFILLFLLKYWIELDICFESIFQELVLAYVIGVAVSRIASLVFSRFLRKMKFYKMADYKDYINVSNKDEKIKVLLINANFYRNLSTTFIISTIIKLLLLINLNIEVYKWITVFGLIILFAAAFIKEEKTITRRINEVKDK